jgi:hypothetical protein
MKSQIPIIISVIILVAMISLSLLYSTTITTYVRTAGSGPITTYWDIIDDELDTLDLVALKYAASPAYNAFTEAFNQYYSYSISLLDRSAVFYTDFTKDPSNDIIAYY